MNMVAVSSSSIALIGYEADSLTLRVVFHDGKTYDYHGVPQEISNQFLYSPSKGQFYIKFIKGRFNPIRIR